MVSIPWMSDHSTNVQVWIFVSRFKFRVESQFLTKFGKNDNWVTLYKKRFIFYSTSLNNMATRSLISFLLLYPSEAVDTQTCHWNPLFLIMPIISLAFFLAGDFPSILFILRNLLHGTWNGHRHSIYSIY